MIFHAALQLFCEVSSLFFLSSSLVSLLSFCLVFFPFKVLLSFSLASSLVSPLIFNLLARQLAMILAQTQQI